MGFHLTLLPACSGNMETVNSEHLQHLAWIRLHIREVLVDSPRESGADHSPEFDGSLLSSPAHTSHIHHEDRLHFLEKIISIKLSLKKKPVSRVSLFEVWWGGGASANGLVTDPILQ